MDALESFFGRNGFLPHGYCFTWTPGLLWTMVTSDLVIAGAYLSIPVAIISFVRRRGEPSNNGVAWLFSAFILACGTTHMMDVWTIWNPDYGLQAVSKAVTAGISLITAIALWPLIPKALKVPSVAQLQSVIASLEMEVQRRRHAEDNLGEIQQNLAVTLASIGAGFIATDREGRVIRMNHVAENLTGWSNHNALGQSLWTVFEREDRPLNYRLKNPVDMVIEGGITVDTVRQVVAISRDGRRTTVEVQAAPTLGDDGAVRGLAIVLRDMTRMVRAEAEAARLAAVVESSSDGIISKTMDGRITSWNAAAEGMFGYRADDAIGQPVQMLIPEDRLHEEMRILTNLSHGESVPAFETQRLRKDGSLIDVSVSISPIRDREGRLIGASKIARDITRQKLDAAALRAGELARIEAQRLEAENQQILEASRLKSQFLANMSHELRTPLNAVIGFADLLHSGYVKPENPKHHEYLGLIGTSGRHLLQLINDVLDLSKVESGKFDFFPEAVDLPVVVDEVKAILNNSVTRKHIVVTTDIDPALTDLRLDPSRLKQVLYNYLSNAIKFTAEGGQVTVRTFAQGEQRFRMEVEDTGIGIAAADLPRLFTEFQQLDAGYSKQHQGTGLGLALTRRLVQAQGGSVGVRSTLGVGSVFHFELNRVHGADAARAGSTPSAVSTPERVLVIEEDTQAQQQMAAAFSQAGFLADAAADSDEALRLARGTRYAALTLDLGLPTQRGLELLSDIRSHGASLASPVVGVSMPTEDLAATFSIANLLCKPIRSHEILRAMAPFVQREGGRANVLVIDDDPNALALMETTLKSIGVEAVCIQDGREALRQMDQLRPDAIILDLMMPGFDGFQVLDALQRMPVWKEVPVYIWTSLLLTDDEYATLARSARAILVKGGGTLEVLLESLRRWRVPLAPAAEGGTW